MANRTAIIHAYRTLYRASLRAVQYSKPARYQVLERLRHNFRSRPADSFDAGVVARTLEFLEGAARTTGLEHKLVKNLLFVWGTRGVVGGNYM